MFAAAARLFLLHFFRRRLDGLFGCGGRLDAQQPLHVLNGIFFKQRVHGALNLHCKTFGLQDIPYRAEEQRDADKNIDHLSPETAHFAKSQGYSRLTEALSNSLVIEVDLLRQIRLPAGRFESDNFA